MKNATCLAAAMTLAGLALGATTGQEARPGGATGSGATGRAFSGRIVDGLGRPVPGVKITTQARREGVPKGEEAIRSGADGRYAGSIPEGVDNTWIDFELDGDSQKLSTKASLDREIVWYREIGWAKISDLPEQQGDEAARHARELLASEEWRSADSELLSFLFLHQDEIRPAFRRLVDDPHVGDDALHWLDLMADPGDQDLFPEGRRCVPKEEVQQADLIEALKVAARQRNYFSSAPEPRISIRFITLSKGLDRALIECGINAVALTGFQWRFVFWKVGHRWEIRSADKVGRG